jgi:hypothetical protein
MGDAAFGDLTLPSWMVVAGSLRVLEIYVSDCKSTGDDEVAMPGDEGDLALLTGSFQSILAACQALEVWVVVKPCLDDKLRFSAGRSGQSDRPGFAFLHRWVGLLRSVHFRVLLHLPIRPRSCTGVPQPLAVFARLLTVNLRSVFLCGNLPDGKVGLANGRF